jgi:hypothetical protein
VAGLIAGWPRVVTLAIIAIDLTALVDAWLNPPWDHLEALAVAALGIALIWQARPTMEPASASTLEGASAP